MRKFLTILLSLSMVLTIAACTQSNSDDDNNEEEEIEDTVNTDDIETEEGGKIADTEDDKNKTEDESEDKSNDNTDSSTNEEETEDKTEDSGNIEENVSDDKESGSKPNTSTSFEPEDLPPNIPYGNDGEENTDDNDDNKEETREHSEKDAPDDKPSGDENDSIIPEPPLEDDPSDSEGIIESEPSQLTEILDSVMAGIDSESLPSSLARMPIEEGMFEYYAFIPYEEGFDGLVYEPMMSSIPWSVVLVSVPADKDAKAVAEEIKQNADPRKWICVEANFVETYVNGNTVMLIMVSDVYIDVAEKMAENFTNIDMSSIEPYNYSAEL